MRNPLFKAPGISSSIVLVIAFFGAAPSWAADSGKTCEVKDRAGNLIGSITVPGATPAADSGAEACTELSLGNPPRAEAAYDRQLADGQTALKNCGNRRQRAAGQSKEACESDVDAKINQATLQKKWMGEAKYGICVSPRAYDRAGSVYLIQVNAGPNYYVRMIRQRFGLGGDFGAVPVSLLANSDAAASFQMYLSSGTPEEPSATPDSEADFTISCGST